MRIEPKHEKAITLMVQGLNCKTVAEQIGVSPETVSRWRGDHSFKAALNTQLKAINEYQQDKLRAMATTALSTIESLMNDTETPAKDRLTAALKILEITQLETRDISIADAKILKAQAREDIEIYEDLYNLEELV